MLIDRTIIIDALVKVAMLVIMTILIPAVKGWIDQNKDNKELTNVLKMASVAVKSVQDAYKGEDGQLKREQAMLNLAKQMESWGLKGFTKEELESYIRTAYIEMKNQAVLTEECEPVADVADKFE